MQRLFNFFLSPFSKLLKLNFSQPSILETTTKGAKVSNDD